MNMPLPEPQIDHAAFREAYAKADAALRLRQAQVYLALTLVLVPVFVGLDYINSTCFLIGSAVISLASCCYATTRRLEESRLRSRLDANNRDLTSTLTKLRETEVQLVQSEKMNALGKLSAGLLHEINNPLNFTFMALQLAREDSRDNADMAETLKDIWEGMNRIKSVIEDLRAFAYPSPNVDRTPLAAEQAVNSAIRLTSQELGAIRIEREGIEDTFALGSATQIVQVLMNLLVNSAHAIKTAGREKDALIKISCVRSNGSVRFAVRDNGCGVDAANLPKLMDPFFTTKAPGEGMGLGLSICHTIITNHGGTIRIASQPGEWTEVSFDLPASVPAHLPARSAA